MKKIYLFFVLLFCLFAIPYSLLPCPARAEGEFTTDFDVTYTVKETGITTVSNKITLTNVFSNLYITSYSLILDIIDPQNIKVFDSSGALESVKTVDGKKTTIQVKFKEPVVGKDKSRIFWVTYEENSFAVRTGEVWEISIPRLAEDANFSSYFINLEVPESLGQEAYVSPNPRNLSQENGFLNYRFSKEDVVKSGITAGFGQFQVFSFNLNYHLENPLARESQTEIALPPDTAFQRMYYTNLNPRPTGMEVDSDGNWIAKYTLEARERVDVTAIGYVQIFATQRPYPLPTQMSLQENLTEQTYWEISHPEIKKLASTLRTPKQIYDYVSQTLKYNDERVRPNVERLGAVFAIQNPTQAICMEFTDLFIAISRAAGIPAREINGFAYTENPKIQPLSLVNDVLHAWPEYYDAGKGVWIPVDPTWGSTTGGVDYFNKLDLRHFTFVIHGKSSTKPYPAGSYKLGANPQKDVFVSFGTLPQERNSKVSVTAKIDRWVPLIPNSLNLTIQNPGPTAIYNITPKVYFDNYEIESNMNLYVLLPFQIYNTQINVPFSFLGAKTPEIIKVIVDGESITVTSNKRQVLIYNLLFVFFTSIIIVVTILFRFKKWKFPKKGS